MATMMSPNPAAANSPTNGTRMGRPPQWTESMSRKLARLYMYTTLPVDKIIKALFPEDNVKKNSAQKTMHKMLGNDPRHLRPDTREEMNTRFKWLHKSHSQRRRRSGETPAENGIAQDGLVNNAYLKEELASPALRDILQQDEADDSRSPYSPLTLYTDESSLHFGWGQAGANTALSPEEQVMSYSPREDLRIPMRPRFAPPVRNDTVFTTSTQMSTDSVRALKNRLSLKSTVYAKQVTVLMKKLTIGSPDDLGTPVPVRAPPSNSRMQSVFGQTGASAGTIPEPGLAVPGDFLLAGKYQAICRTQRHVPGTSVVCWCGIYDDINADNFFITERGELCDRGLDVMNGLMDPSCVDQFGNTLLHLFAAREDRSGQEDLLGLIASNRVSLSVINKADQTFLHLLSAAWFRGLYDASAPLYRLLEVVRVTCPALVYNRDIYGRTFFHQFFQLADDHQAFNQVAQGYDLAAISRDAFNRRPSMRTHDSHMSAPRRMGTVPLSPLAEEAQEEHFPAKNMGLLSVVKSCYEDPNAEDDEGRNGLQCLAEMSMAIDSPNPNQAPSSPKSKGSLKRKHGQDEPDHVTPIVRKLEFLEGLLMTTQVNPDHYNARGDTVLTTFVENLPDEGDDKNKTIAKLLDKLLDRVGNIDGRNRRGETALLVAARCGHKAAVSKLLERGANPHARDKDGRGMMGVIDLHISQAKTQRDLPVYGRLEAIRAVMAKQLEERRVQQEPSTLDEWTWLRPQET